MYVHVCTCVYLHVCAHVHWVPVWTYFHVSVYEYECM